MSTNTSAGRLVTTTATRRAGAEGGRGHTGRGALDKGLIRVPAGAAQVTGGSITLLRPARNLKLTGREFPAFFHVLFTDCRSPGVTESWESETTGKGQLLQARLTPKDAEGTGWMTGGME